MATAIRQWFRAYGHIFLTGPDIKVEMVAFLKKNVLPVQKYTSC